MWLINKFNIFTQWLNDSLIDWFNKNKFSWRELFEELEDQLIQFDGATVNDDIDSIIDEERKKKVNVKNAFLKEPKLAFTIENQSINITYHNVDYFIIKFYLIDLEVLFSRTPFFKQVWEIFI